MAAKKPALADLPPGAENPLNAAVTQRDASVLEMVERAVSAGEVMLAYQPVMQARAPDTTAFYEGLVRVLDATGRVIPAGQFMAQAEESELGRKLDVQALRLGLRMLTKFPGLRLSINMSARSIGYSPWRKTLDRFLKKDPTVGERLILEITEASTMTVPDIVASFMAEMQRGGISFAVDNFGAGPVAVRHFRQFYFDAVKLDGQVIRGIHRDADNQVVTAALMAMAREFDMFTVAKDVEDAADAAFLTEIGVDCLQGYHFGAPTVRPPWLPERESLSA